MLNTNPVSWKQMQNLDLGFIQMSLLINSSVRISSKCHWVVSLTFYYEIVDCELLKQSVWGFHWHLPIADHHLESNESGSGAGFMVSGIRIRFQKIWPKQMQRSLKPVSLLGLIKQGLRLRHGLRITSIVFCGKYLSIHTSGSRWNQAMDE